MSHFKLYVLTDKCPTNDVLDMLMQPYHEFESTGHIDQYVKTIEVIDEKLDDWETSMKDIRFRPETQEVRCFYDDIFYRDPTPEEEEIIGMGSGVTASGLMFYSKDWEDGKGYRTKVLDRDVEGWEISETTMGDFCSFFEYITEYCGIQAVKNTTPEEELIHNETYMYGWAEYDEDKQITRVVERTNPLAKWDFWVRGGRYADSLKLVRNSLAALQLEDAIKENPDVKPEYRTSPQNQSYRIEDIDFQGMIWDAEKRAESKYDLAHRLLGEELKSYKPFTHFYKAHNENREKAREEYLKQPAVVRHGELIHEYPQLLFMNLGLFQGDRGEYVKQETRWVGVPFAVIDNGEWMQAGKAQWWGIITEENENWPNEFWEYVQKQPKDRWLTVIDCHI